MWQVRLPIPYYYGAIGAIVVHYVDVPALYLCQSQLSLHSVLCVDLYWKLKSFHPAAPECCTVAAFN
jgi:hypothetical protein